MEHSFVNKGIKYMIDPDYRFQINANLGLYDYLDDEPYLKRLYKAQFGKELQLDNPQSFNEKLQWLKLNDRNPKYSLMVDKYAAKDYVSNIIGEEHIIPTLGIWDSFKDINFNSLPNSFVLKCTHNSGQVYIIKDCKNYNLSAIQSEIDKALKTDYYKKFREWPYKNVKPRVLAESFISEGNNSLVDYKFYCFNGEPKFLYVSSGLDNHDTANISFLTLDWEFAPFRRSDYAPFVDLPPKPTMFNEMIDIAKALSSGLPFVRVDLYQSNSRVLFSELTFYPAAGFMLFSPEEWDYHIGKMLELPQL